MYERIIKFGVLLLLSFLPSFAFAQVSITEIFYSPAKIAWVEIYNAGETSVDLTNYKILDSGASVNGHSITAMSIGLLGPKSYAVIAKDPRIFSKAKYPVYKSSLGIKVSGDSLILKDASGNLTDKVVFTSSDGTTRDKSSLQRVGDSWQALTPTPGQDPTLAIQNQTQVVPKSTKMSSETKTQVSTVIKAGVEPATSSLIFSDRPAPAHHWWDVISRFFGFSGYDRSSQ